MTRQAPWRRAPAPTTSSTRSSRSSSPRERALDRADLCDHRAREVLKLLGQAGERVMSQTLATARRVMSQLRHDPRTIALVLVVPCVLMTTLRFVYDHHLRVFDQAGTPLLAVFPLATMFVVSSVAVLRERRNGTLERLLTTPISRLALLGGYAIAFALLATVQAISVCALALGPLDLHVAG